MDAANRVKLSALALAGLVAACTGSAGKSGKPCTIVTSADGTSVLQCPDDGGTLALPGAVDASASTPGSCTVSAVDGGSQISCADGTKTFVPNGINGAPGASAESGKSCMVQDNADGTKTLTCPGEDGGMVTISVRSAQANFATLSDEDKAGLDMKIAVSGVTVPASNQPVVSLKVTDQWGNGIAGLPAGNFRFALLKLVPTTPAAGKPAPVGANGSANDTWVSYMAATPTSTAGTETAAATAAATNGVLKDNGDGTYVYTFTRKVTDAGVPYDANATHRLVILMYQTVNSLQVFAPVNFVKDFVPATGASVDGKNEKIDPAACAECHGSFRTKAGGTGAFHGGARYDFKTCVACHNDQRRNTALPGTGTTPSVDLDAPGVVGADGKWTGNAALVNGEAFINLPIMIHKIHMGEELTLKGGTYPGIAMPYETTYPQDIRNCDKCHRKVAMADNFKSKPSRRACGSCHDGTSFTFPAPAGRKTHVGGAATEDASCITCHPATGAKAPASIGVLDAHVSVIPPDPLSSFFGGTGSDASRRNAAWMPAAGNLPAGAAKIAYEIKSVERDTNGNPVMVFRFTKDGTPVVFNTYAAGSVTELMDDFIGSPSLQFAYAIPQDGIEKPADFNVAPSVYLRTLWGGAGTGGSAGTLAFDSATGYYTATLTGIVIPDNAVMLTGGIGYSYSLGSTTPLTQTNVPGFPYGDATVVTGCATSQKCGGLVVTAGDAWKTATGYTARRPIIDNAKCLACHEQLGVKPSFHVGQRNDGPTCAFCHLPNRTSSGWSASSGVFVHAIHGASIRSQDDNWHAACPPGTAFPATCSKENASPYYAKITYPGKLNNCSQCHAAGTFDFSASASAAALPNLLPITVAAGVLKPAISTSAYVTPLLSETGTDFGNVFSTGNITSGTVAGTACTTAAPCACTVAAPCVAADTTLVNSPVTSVCSSCHDSDNARTHFKMFGGSFYETRGTAKTKSEQCLMCHGPGSLASIAVVHR